MADPLLEQLTGEATVPEALPAPSMEEQQMGGLLGRSFAGLAGVARTATFGLSDQLLTEAAYVGGGESARKDMLRGLNVAKQVNPYTSMAGEMAGLFVGGGTGITRLGEAVEGGLAARLGEGLGGSVASMAGRGAVEGAMLGVGSAISEATLGNTDLTAEKLFAHASKDALMGGVAGGVLGGLGYGARRAFDGLLGGSSEAVGAGEALATTKGPTPNAVLDEVAGVEGGGKAVLENAKALQASVGEVRAAGATGEQAAKLVDEANALAKATTSSDASIAAELDAKAAAWAKARSGGNPEMEEALSRVYEMRRKGLRTYEAVVEESAMKLADSGTRMFRNAEDLANEVQFAQKANQFERLLDPSKVNAQADHVAGMLQDVDDVLRLIETTEGKGGIGIGVREARKAYKDALTKVQELGTGRSSVTMERASRELYFAANTLKQEVGRVAQFGKARPNAPIAEGAERMQGLYDSMKVALEDTEVWGQAGAAQKRWNESFANFKRRRDNFGKDFAEVTDEQAGRILIELDPRKAKSALNSLRSEADSKIIKDNVEAVIAGNRDRLQAIREFGALTPRQQKLLDDGAKAIDEFEATWKAAQKEANVAGKIKELQLQEQGQSIGGILGLAADIVQRPVTTMERLAALRQTAAKVEGAVKSSLDRFFSGKKTAEALTSTADKAVVADQIAAVRDVSTNTPALSERVRKMVGDLTEHAPQTAASMQAVAMRAMTYLASEAPQPRVTVTLGSSIGKHRYSDTQLTEWSRKRDAVMDPTSVVRQLQHGKLSREGIRAVETVYPKLFAQMQDMAREHIEKLAIDGKLDDMPRIQQAAIASLLKVPPNETWQPDFMLLMAGAKAIPAQRNQPQSGPAPLAKRPIRINNMLFETEAQQIEGRTT